MDGTKFRAVASMSSVRDRLAREKYLASCEKADEESAADIDRSAVLAALEQLKQHPEPEVGLIPHVPANRAIHNQGDGTLFDRSLFP